MDFKDTPVAHVDGFALFSFHTWKLQQGIAFSGKREAGKLQQVAVIFSVHTDLDLVVQIEPKMKTKDVKKTI